VRVLASGVEFDETPHGRLVDMMRAGHRLRTGHELDAEYVPSETDEGLFILVRHCCKEGS